MSPIPSYDLRGYLPPYIGLDGRTPDRSPYRSSMTEVVAQLGTTSERKKLLKGLLEYRELLFKLEYVQGLQLVNGSFV